jgi:hypothetical protein
MSVKITFIVFCWFPCLIQVGWHMVPFILVGKTWQWCLIKSAGRKSSRRSNRKLKVSPSLIMYWLSWYLSPAETLQSNIGRIATLSCYILFPLYTTADTNYTSQLLRQVGWACLKSSIVGAESFRATNFWFTCVVFRTSSQNECILLTCSYCGVKLKSSNGVVDDLCILKIFVIFWPCDMSSKSAVLVIFRNNYIHTIEKSKHE